MFDLRCSEFELRCSKSPGQALDQRTAVSAPPGRDVPELNMRKEQQVVSLQLTGGFWVPKKPPSVTGSKTEVKPFWGIAIGAGKSGHPGSCVLHG
jgi:hypothetical protein